MKTHSKWNISIRWLLMTTYLVSAVIFGGLTSLAVSHVVKSELRGKLTSDAKEIASRLAADSTLALALKSEARAEGAAVAALSLAHVQYVAIYRADHKIFYEHGSLAEDARGIDESGGNIMRISGETPSAIYVVAPVILKSDVDGVLKHELLGHVRLGMSKQGYIDIEHQLQRSVWLIILILGVLFLTSLWAITQRVTAPLSKLVGTIRHAEETGDLSAATVEGTADVRGIASAYNSLLQELKQDRLTLETRVKERTRDLLLAKEETERLVEENRRLIQSMTRLSEEERRYVAHEIHDQLNALLVAVRLGLQRVQKSVQKLDSKDPEVREVQSRVREIGDMVDQGYAIARKIIHQLRPEVIDALGLKGAMEEMADNYDRLHPSCRFVLQIEGDLAGIHDDVGMAIYRIAQEALNNTVKHAKAARVIVTIRRLRRQGLDMIFLSIEDNGIGFDGNLTVSGVGILSMRERVRALNGEFEIRSSLSGGTKLHVVLPIFETTDTGAC